VSFTFGERLPKRVVVTDSDDSDLRVRDVTDRSRSREFIQEGVDIVQVINLVEDDEVSSADSVKLSVEFLEGVSRSKTTFRTRLHARVTVR